MSAETKWPVGGYAPGHYTCKCFKCGNAFVGEKRAYQCADCVIQDLRALPAAAPVGVDALAAKAKKLLEGVTPGPWTLDGPVWNQTIWSSGENRVCFMAHSNGLDDARDGATARFIAATRTLVPELVAALAPAQPAPDAPALDADAVAALVEAETERCAKVAEDRHFHWHDLGSRCLVDDDISACHDIAAAIRAKGGEA